MAKRLGGLLAVALSVGALVGAVGIHAAMAGDLTKAVSGVGGGAQGTELHKRLTDLYMESNWEDLERDLGNTPRDLPGMSAVEKGDILYLRQTMLELRPAWWKQAKAGKTFNFRPSIWGKTLAASFDPTAKTNVEVHTSNGSSSFAFMWPSDAMDSTDNAEHGFTKGDLNSLQVWSIFGMGDAYASTVQLQMNMTVSQTRMLQRFVDFRSNVTGTYYASPRGRRWGMWLCTAAYMQKYAADVTGRKPVGAMLVAEVVMHGDKYPSLTLPESKDEQTEENIVLSLKDQVEKKGWTFAEDRSLRDLLKAFAVTNDGAVLKGGKVLLQSNLPIALDPEQDKPLMEKRDAWIKAQLEKVAKKGAK